MYFQKLQFFTELKGTIKGQLNCVKSLSGLQRENMHCGLK